MLVAFTVHEFAHAWTAWKFGDPTAYREGRVTLNPMAHLDWIGVLFLLLAGFGWAKPVPVRRGNFRRPRLMSVVVTAAGPLSNLLLAFLGLLVWFALAHGGTLRGVSPGTSDTVLLILDYWLNINLMLFLFNLIPLPPLDGYRIAEEFAPWRWRLRMQQYEQWGVFIFLLLVVIPPLREVTIGPLFDLRAPLVRGMLQLLDALFGGGGGGGAVVLA
jgi:Zn-dependent protease